MKGRAFSIILKYVSMISVYCKKYFFFFNKRFSNYSLPIYLCSYLFICLTRLLNLYLPEKLSFQSIILKLLCLVSIPYYRNCTVTVLPASGLYSFSDPVAKFIIPDWWDKVDSGTGLSYRPAMLLRLHCKC